VKEHGWVLIELRVQCNASFYLLVGWCQHDPKENASVVSVPSQLEQESMLVKKLNRLAQDNMLFIFFNPSL